MQDTTELVAKARCLIEALPYIQNFSGKVFVIKCGGSVLTNPTYLEAMMRDIALLFVCGIRPVLIHGGGPDISEMCKRLDIKSSFVNGQRVTDAETLSVVEMVLLGKTNTALVNKLNQFNIKAIGVSGHDAAFLQAEKFIPTNENGEQADLGFVGNITSVDTNFLHKLLDAKLLPVIAPIGVDRNGQSYNINADIAAGAIAAALHAEKLILLSDINGLYADYKDPSTLMSSIKIRTIKLWLKEKRIEGGMIPKLQACMDALEQGAMSAHILNGQLPHSLLLEIFTDQGIGTMVTH